MDIKEYHKKYYQKHKKKFAEYQKTWIKKHRQRYLEIKRKSNDKKNFGGLKGKVLKRDKNKCRICGAIHHLLVHHKDKNRQNNTMNNLITLCDGCHIRLHRQKVSILNGYKKR